MDQIDSQEESKLLEYIVDRDWIEPVKPLWDPKTSKKSCAYIVAARTGKSVKQLCEHWTVLCKVLCSFVRHNQTNYQLYQTA